MNQPGNHLRICLAALSLLLGPLALRADAPAPLPATAAPADLFNAGTKQLQAGKLPAAEDLLKNAVTSQDPAVQPPALYNLGYARVAEGTAILKQGKDPKGRATPAQADDLTAQAGAAGQQIDAALASENEQNMVMAYLRGGGVHREINAATKAVKKALESQRQALAKWQRAAGDFRSAAELDPTATDATYNARATEHAIATLIDKLNQLQQAGARMTAAGKALGDKMQQLKGKIPAAAMPPGAGGDDNDDEDSTGLQPGEQEGAGKNGDEVKMSPEEAEQLLNGYKLGGDHPLRFGDEGKKKPLNQTGKTW
jgi:tetratricopeptide (TPR) repeat protein